MKKTGVVFGCLLLLLICWSCDDPLPKPEGRMFYLEFSYRNAAWGRHHAGFIVDPQGNVHVYNNPARWNESLPGKVISPAQLEENLALTTPAKVTVSSPDLATCADLAPRVSDESYSKRIHSAYDAGSVVYLVYRYDPRKERYNAVWLKEEGDFTSENLDSRAGKLVTILKDLHRQIYSSSPPQP